MTTNLVRQAEWDAVNNVTAFGPLPADDGFRLWLSRFLPRGPGDCLEIGCFPGRFLAAMGDLGYRLNWIDLTPRTDVELPQWLAAQGYDVGTFARADFTTYPFAQRFQVVSSFGFIEHFTDWHEVLGHHADLVAPDGFLVIEAPNMAGLLQRVLRQLFDKQNLAGHWTPAMHADCWAAVARRLGFEILFCGAIGGYAFWRSEPMSGAKAALAALVDLLGPVLGQRPETQSQATAGYVGMIARRCGPVVPSTDPAAAADLKAIADEIAAKDRQTGADASRMAAMLEAWCAVLENKGYRG